MKIASLIFRLIALAGIIFAMFTWQYDEKKSVVTVLSNQKAKIVKTEGDLKDTQDSLENEKGKVAKLEVEKADLEGELSDTQDTLAGVEKDLREEKDDKKRIIAEAAKARKDFMAEIDTRDTKIQNMESEIDSFGREMEAKKEEFEDKIRDFEDRIEVAEKAQEASGVRAASAEATVRAAKMKIVMTIEDPYGTEEFPGTEDDEIQVNSLMANIRKEMAAKTPAESEHATVNTQIAAVNKKKGLLVLPIGKSEVSKGSNWLVKRGGKEVANLRFVDVGPKFSIANILPSSKSPSRLGKGDMIEIIK